MPLPAVVGVGLAVARGGLTAASLLPLVKPAIGIAKRFLKQKARPGIGSKVTKGPLVVGKQTVYGKPRPGIGRVAGAAGAIGAGGIGVVASHRTTKPATQTKPQVQVPRSSPPTKTDEKKCCPVGTKRMVCFKRGRVKKRKAKAKAKPRRKPRAVARKRKRKSNRKG
jgi:hypothetical protein